MAQTGENDKGGPLGPGKGAEDGDLVPRPDNVGQSRRWRREDKDATEAERGSYGNDESHHSTDQGWPDPGSPADLDKS